MLTDHIKSPKKSNQRLVDRNRDAITNELVDGSLLDVGGAIMMFQSPRSLRAVSATMDPRQIIDEYNSMNPQCPVFMHTLQFQFISQSERVLRTEKRLRMCSQSSSDMFHVPYSDYSDVAEDRRPHVFPACGHVHGYSKSLLGR